MRYFVLGLGVLTLSTTAASAQTYLPARDYSGPNTIVQLDVLQGGSSGGGYGAYGGSHYAPILSMPLPPPISPPPITHTEYIAEAPPVSWVEPVTLDEPIIANPVMDMTISNAPLAAQTARIPTYQNHLLPPASLSEQDVFITPATIAALPDAQQTIHEVPYRSTQNTASNTAPNAAAIQIIDIQETPVSVAPIMPVADNAPLPVTAHITWDMFDFQTPDMQVHKAPLAVSPHIASVTSSVAAPVVPPVASSEYVPVHAPIPAPVMPETSVMPVSADRLLPPAILSEANVFVTTTAPVGVALAPAVSDGDEAFRLLFNSGSSELNLTDLSILNGVVDRMKSDPRLRLRVQAYAAGTPETSGQARRLSLARAMVIRNYMTEQGIASTRLDVRALGAGSAAFGDNAASGKAPDDRADMVFMRG